MIMANKCNKSAEVSPQRNNLPNVNEEQIQQQNTKSDPTILKKLQEERALLDKFNQIDECPIFRPTLAEFTEKSFSDYLIDCESKCGTDGIFKVSISWSF